MSNMNDESIKMSAIEINQLAEIASCWDEINSVLGEYVNIMDTVQSSAVKDGHIHVALSNLFLFSKRFYNCSIGLGSSVASKSKSLVSKIEDIDLDLFRN